MASILNTVLSIEYCIYINMYHVSVQGVDQPMINEYTLLLLLSFFGRRQHTNFIVMMTGDPVRMTPGAFKSED